MLSLRVVTEAKALLEEAQGWWPWSWASTENQRAVRSAIEGATAALDREVAKAKTCWSDEMKSAYQGKSVEPRINRVAQALKEAEAACHRATEQAKRTFDEAEREWNAAKARDGALEAKAAIEKHEAILKMAKATGSG
jgi:uncharacterized protein YukE